MRNKSIDFTRLWGAILVVAIHTSPLLEINSDWSFFITQGIARIAVPFFFAVSGYYTCKRLSEGKTAWRSVWNILKIYIFVSMVYFCVEFAHTVRETGISIKVIGSMFLRDTYLFFCAGSYFHLWYFPALLYAMITVCLLFQWKCQKLILPLAGVLYIIGAVCVSYPTLTAYFPFLSFLFRSEEFFAVFSRIVLRGFPLFSSGLLIYSLQKWLSKKQIAGFLAFSAVLWLAEYGFMRCFWQKNSMLQPISLYPLILFLMLFLLQHPAASFPAGGYCKTTASFMYYFHPLGILFVQRFTERPTIVFAAVTEIFLLVGCVVYAVDIWIKKHFPKKKKVSN